MACEWREVSLYDVADYINGRPTKPSELCADGVPVIKIAELNRGVTDETDRVPPDLVEEKHWVSDGDLLFAWSGSVGIYQYHGLRAALNQHIFRVVAKPGVDQGFLRYLLQSQLPTFLDYVENKKTTMGHVTVRDLKLTQVQVPPLSEQRAIAHILGTLDDKIKLNRRMNETMEAMARAIFKAWFVDFEPVRAKMEGHWRRGESLPGLPAHLYDLFPDRLVNCEIGEIPEGWGEGSVGELAEVSSGKRPGVGYPEASVQANVPLWGGNGPMGFVPFPLIDYPILLTGRVGTLGSVFRITSPCWPSDNTLVLKPRQPLIFEYLFLQLQRIDFDSLNRGSTQPLVTQTDLSSQPVLLPPTAILERFHAHAGKLYGKIDALENESRTLAALRDAILPKLISGEIRVFQ